MTRPAFSIGFAVVIAFTMVACGNNQPTPEPTSPAPTSPATISPSPTESAPVDSPTPTATVTTTTQPPQSWPTSPVSAEPQNPGSFDIADVRVGAHDGFDRVVIELAGGAANQATWKVEYEPNPHTQGKGDLVDLPGNATLRVVVYGLVTPPGHTTQTRLLDNSAHGNVTGVYHDPVFEGQAQVFIGLDRVRGLRVSTLDSPTRIVIDIQS